jgi:hypothetical protein
MLKLNFSLQPTRLILVYMKKSDSNLIYRVMIGDAVKGYPFDAGYTLGLIYRVSLCWLISHFRRRCFLVPVAAVWG